MFVGWRIVLAVFPLTLALAASCKDGGADDSDDSDGDMASLMADEAKIFELQLSSCAMVDKCFVPLRNSLSNLSTGLENQDLRAERCSANARNTFEQLSWPGLLDSVASGRAVYHPERLAACLKADAERECYELSSTPEPCLEAFAGTVKLGDPCATQYDCGPGAYCDIGLTPDATCPNVCKPRFPDGSTCMHAAECEAGLRCFDPAFMPPNAPDQRCRPPSDVGEGCHGIHCLEDLVCGASSSGDRTCQPLERAQQPGDACGLTSQCEGSAACRAEAAGAAPTCVLATEGMSCSRSSECSTDEHCACTDAACSTKTCRPWPVAGEACGRASASVGGICAQGLFCTGDSCQPKRKLGDDCANNGACWSFHCVDGICTAPGDCG
jgi:hypothetical protein